MVQLTLVKERISCQILPASLNSIDNALALNLQSMAFDDETRAKLKTKQDRLIQQTKRDMLELYVERNECIVRGRQKIYEHELAIFKQRWIDHGDSRCETNIFDSLQKYFNHLTETAQKEIQFKVTFFGEGLAMRQ